MAWKLTLSPCGPWLVAAVVLAGCQEQGQIHDYTAPKEPPLRLVAVMVHRKDAKDTWFFKLMGPADEIAKHVETFDDFVATVHFTGKSESPIEWTVPRGWSEEHSNEKIYAAIRYAGEGIPLPIQVTVMRGNAGGLPANLARWRTQQLQLPMDSMEELMKLAEKLENNLTLKDGIKATRVDFIGSESGLSPRRAAPRRVPQAPAFTFHKPDDWKQLPSDRRGIVKRDAVFQVKHKGLVAQTTVVRSGGGSLLNVNRWRDQLGLAPFTQDELAKNLRTLDTASGRADSIELTGRGADGERMTLGAWLSPGEQTWFITMKGPAELVKQQRSAFESFVKSFRLDGGAGVAHE